MNRMPYIYKLTFKPQNLVYIGSSTRVGCHPDKFWKTYFTSSKVIEQLISLFGISDDVWVYEILHQPKQYDDIKDIVRLENLMIFELLNGPNKHNAINEMCYKTDGGVFTASGSTRSDETRAKISKSRTGVKRTNYVAGDKTVYKFKHKDTDETFVGTRREFSSTYPLTAQEVYNLIKRGFKHSQGWGVYIDDQKCYSFETSYNVSPKLTEQFTCEYCGTSASLGNYKRWHGPKCRAVINLPYMLKCA